MISSSAGLAATSCPAITGRDNLTGGAGADTFRYAETQQQPDRQVFSITALQRGTSSICRACSMTFSDRGAPENSVVLNFARVLNAGTDALVASSTSMVPAAPRPGSTSRCWPITAAAATRCWSISRTRRTSCRSLNFYFRHPQTVRREAQPDDRLRRVISAVMLREGGASSC